MRFKAKASSSTDITTKKKGSLFVDDEALVLKRAKIR